MVPSFPLDSVTVGKVCLNQVTELLMLAAKFLQFLPKLKRSRGASNEVAFLERQVGLTK